MALEMQMGFRPHPDGQESFATETPCNNQAEIDWTARFIAHIMEFDGFDDKGREYLHNQCMQYLSAKYQQLKQVN